jgi:hypothetical protein
VGDLPVVALVVVSGSGSKMKSLRLVLCSHVTFKVDQKETSVRRAPILGTSAKSPPLIFFKASVNIWLCAITHLSPSPPP